STLHLLVIPQSSSLCFLSFRVMFSVALHVLWQKHNSIPLKVRRIVMGDPQQKPCKDSDTPKDDPGQKPPEGGGGEKQEPPKDDGCGGDPKPPRKCGTPEAPANPCDDPSADPAPPPPPDNCVKPPFKKEIDDL